MRVDVAWSATADRQFKALSRSQQDSARNVAKAIKASPRAAHYYNTAQQRDGTVRAVWVAYGLEVRVLFTLSEDGRRLLLASSTWCRLICRVSPTTKSAPPCNAEGAMRPADTISSLLDEYIAGLRRKGRKEATLRAYRGDLAAASAAFPQPITELRRDALEAWLGDAPAASTQARRLASLRGFFEWCLARELIPRDPTLGLEARSTTRRLPRPVQRDTDRKALDAAIRAYPDPYRVIFTLLRETGMRVGEVLALNVGDVSLAPGNEGLHVRDPKNRVERDWWS